MTVLAAVLAGHLLLAPPDVDASPTDPEVVVDHFVRPAPYRPPAPPWTQIPIVAPTPDYEPDPFYCRPEAPFPNDDCIAPPEPSDPTDEESAVGPGDIAREIRRIGLPRLRVSVQPEGSTLVNLETIFHTTAAPFARSVDILDSTVDLRAEPASFTWHHGDGTTQTTTTPGRPYPAMDVIHQYAKPGNVRARVDVTYRVTYRIDDGDWETLDAPITAPGPAVALRVREARPVLTQ